MPRQVNYTKKLIGLVQDMLSVLQKMDSNPVPTTPTPGVKPMREMAGREHSGMLKANGRLTEQGIAHMFELFDQGHTKSQVARKFGVTYRAVQLRENAWLAQKEEAKRQREEAAKKRAATREAKKKEAAKNASSNSRTPVTELKTPKTRVTKASKSKGNPVQPGEVVHMHDLVANKSAAENHSPATENRELENA